MKSMTYKTVPGFFLQDDLNADPVAIGAVPPRFGLIDESPDRWHNLYVKLGALIEEGRSTGKMYKLVLFGRHGQGWHNVAEEKYGTVAWDEYWAKQNGDDELTWGPDPDLTPLGEEQAVEANKVWKQELENGRMTLPGVLYSSPMTRAIHTNQITFSGIDTKRVLILENCREEYGEHTCDKRHPRSFIADKFREFDIEDGFTEEDELYQQDARETFEHAVGRAKAVLDRMFTVDNEALFVSVTAHSGIINAFLGAVGRPRYALPTGGVIPVVVEASEL
ncbi:unnamed protein product [Mycena citricolor]|uniref:Phosphoglycerate mutase n=1 Tax=Mycena citricolor TaxID=2018698 RepID=A0AAD2K867_9AGAR|nr:unnamed protein product [Mycena citricolor]